MNIKIKNCVEFTNSMYHYEKNGGNLEVVVIYITKEEVVENLIKRFLKIKIKKFYV